MKPRGQLEENSYEKHILENHKLTKGLTKKTMDSYWNAERESWKLLASIYCRLILIFTPIFCFSLLVTQGTGVFASIREWLQTCLL